MTRPQIFRTTLVLFAATSTLSGVAWSSASSSTQPASRPAATQPAATRPVTYTGETHDVSFGEKMTKKDLETVSAAKVLADPKAYDGKELRLTGTVDKVCANRGCWLSLGSPASEESIFVKFTCPIDGRLIPTEAKGLEALIEGTLEIKEIPEEDARHLAEESGKSADEIAAITGPQTQIGMKSPAAMVRNLPIRVE